jgi:Flp pilus assembly pilin Flp
MDLSIRAHAFIVGLLTGMQDREEGQDLIEYAMLGGLIAAGIVAVLVLFGGKINDMITGIGNCIDFTNSTACTPGF